MARTVLLALALALSGGAPYFGGLVDLLHANWTAGQVDAGSHYDPNGSGGDNDAGGHFDPNG